MEELTLVIMGLGTILGSYIVGWAYQNIKVWFGLQNSAATVFAFIFGGVLGAIGFWLGWVVNGTTLLQAILQGLISAFIAVGRYKYNKQMAKKGY